MSDPAVNILIRARSDLNAAIQQIRSQITGLNQALGTIGSSTGPSNLSANLNNLSQSSRRTTTDVGSLEQSVLGLSESIPAAISGVKSLAVGLLGVGVGKFLKDAADAAARTEVLGTVLNVVAKNAGYTAEQIAKVDKQVQSMGITASASRQSLVQFIQAGLDVNRAAELARAAQDLAVVADQNSSETFKKLITNIQQLDTLGLRFMGVVVDAAAAYETYAKIIGKTADELGQTEKQQAFFNAAMSESVKLSGTYEASMGNVSKQIQSLARLQENLSVTIGNNLLPAYSALVEVFSDFLKKAGLAIDEQGKQVDGAQAFAEAVRTAAEALSEIALLLVEHKDLLITVLKYYVEFKIAYLIFGGLTKVVTTLSTATLNLATTPTAFSGAWAKAANFIQGSLGSLYGTLTSLAKFLSKGLYIVIAWEVGTGFGEWLNQFSVVKNTAALLVEGVMDMFDILASSLTAVGGLLLAPFKALAKGSTDALKEAWDNAGALGARIVDKIKNSTDNAAKLITGYDRNAAEAGQRLAKESEQRIISLRDAFSKQISLQKESEALSLRIKQAEASGETEVADKLKDQEKELTKKLAKQNEAVELVKKEGFFAKETADYIKSEAQAQDVVITQQRNKQAVLKGLTDSMKNLGLETQVALDGIDTYVSSGFAQAVGAFEQINKGLSGALDIEPSKVKLLGGLKEIQQALFAMAAGAKSPEEIAIAIERITRVSSAAQIAVKSMQETLQVRFEKSTMDELNTAVEGLIERQKQLTEIMKTASAVSQDEKDASRALEAAIKGVGGSAEAAKKGVMDLGRELKGVASQNVSMDSAINVQKIEESVSKAKALYQQNLRNIEEVYDRQAGLILETLQGEKITAAKLQALDKETVAKRLQSTDEYYNAVKSARDKALELWQSYAKQVAEIDDKKLTLEENRQKAIQDLRRQGMTDAQKNADQLKELAELESSQKKALYEGDFEAASKLGEKRIQIAEEVAKFEKTQGRDSAEFLNEIYNDQKGVLETQRNTAVSAAQAQEQAYGKLSETVKDLSSKMKDLLQEQVVDLKVKLNLESAKTDLENIGVDKEVPVKVQVDQGSLNAMINEIENAIKRVSASVKVGVSTATTVSRAMGGYISGPGTSTSDSIMARLSNGEYVIRASAVKRYGVGFMEALNNMVMPSIRMPAFAEGGLVTTAPSSGANGLMDSVNLNINFNGSRMKLSGDRENVNAFVRELKKASRGSI